MIEPPDLNSIIPLIFFSANQQKDPKNLIQNLCNHLGFLVKDGFHHNKEEKIQRIKCSACQKRFGNDVSMYELYTYQTRLQSLIFDLFFKRISQKVLESTWQIPQSKLSRFKKTIITQLFHDQPSILQTSKNLLPRGVLKADETFMGKRGNSNTIINMINADYQTIATGPAHKGDLLRSIQEVYMKIPASDRKRLRLLVTDGEPSYEFIPLEAGGRVIHVQQLHAKKLLGQVIINKYEKFGPHHLHYMIYTHWKIFNQGKIELKFKWEIKFIKANIKIGRGRPLKEESESKEIRQWRQKKNEYYSKEFEKEGTASVFINTETETISLRAGAKSWMINMFLPVLKEFNGKCITNNGSESKHSQIKRRGASRKQKDVVYANNIFQFSAYLAEKKVFPPMVLKGRPLYHYLLKPSTPKKEQYQIYNSDLKSKQIMLSAFIK
jgi:hypothetical protein